MHNLNQSPWQWWRQQMPISPNWAYFDHAAVGPLSSGAQNAIAQYADQAANLGDTVWPEWAANLGELRKCTAQLLNAETDEIALIPNTSTGINLVAEGWPWRPGDNVILPEGEFPSNLFPWQNQQAKGVEVRIVPRRGNNEVHAEDLIAKVDQQTRIISLSWVGYASGFRVDLESLVQQAHQRGACVFLDAIQGLGMFPLDIAKTPIDFLAADGHKWLLGPEGMGVAMIRKQHLNRLRCGNVGWNSVTQAFNYQEPEFALAESARRFEPGSANMSGTAGLLASMEMFLQVREAHGDSAIGQRVVELATTLHEMLGEIGVPTRLPHAPSARSGIVTFEVPGHEPAKVRQAALEKNVVVSCRGGGVRASIHAYNDQSDLERLVDVVRSFVS